MGTMPQRLSLEVQLMSEPCLWRWEIRDPERDVVVESSWARMFALKSLTILLMSRSTPGTLR